MFASGPFRSKATKFLCMLVGTLLVIFSVQNINSRISTSLIFSRNNEKLVRSFPALPLQKKEACNEKRNIIYLKTHKTGSTTLQNIFFRFGEDKNLSFALPHANKKLPHQFPYKSDDLPTVESWPAGGRFRTAMVANWEENKHFDLLVQHMIWNRAEAEKAVPDGYRITILREPVSRFVSDYSYYEYYRAKPLDTFAREVEASSSTGLDRCLILPRGHCPPRNYPLYDIGLNDTQDMIPTFKQDFDQVLIMEYFEESLILLADALCWNLMDVRFIKLNEGKTKEHKDATPRNSSWPGLRIWTAEEQELYQHFLKVHRDRVQVFGEEKMKSAVLELQLLNQHLQAQCARYQSAPRSKKAMLAQDPDFRICTQSKSEKVYTVHLRSLALNYPHE